METTIGYKIRKVRKIKGLSQQYVAKKLGISQAAYSSIESGKTNVNEKKLECIAAAIDVEPDVIKNFNEQVVFNSCTQSSFSNTDYINSLEKIQKVYKKLLKEKDARIKVLEQLVSKERK